jgi:hypothetical protein
LLRRELRAGETWYELVHEKLVEYVSAWLMLDRTFTEFRVARDLVANSCRGELWRDYAGALLNLGQVDDVVGPFRDRLRLDKSETEFMFRSAIRSGSKHARHWADRYGYEPSVDILLRCLEDKDLQYRLGALTVAAQFSDPDGRITRACQQQASDPQLAIRRVVGSTLAHLRSSSRLPSQLGETEPERSRSDGRSAVLWLRNIIPLTPAMVDGRPGVMTRWPERAKATVRTVVSSLRQEGLRATLASFRLNQGTELPIETLAAMVAAGDRLDDQPYVVRIRAYRYAVAQLRDERAEEIKAVKKIGTNNGAGAGVAWGATFGMVGLYLFSLVDELPKLFGFLPSMLVSHGILGAAIGKAAVHNAAPEILLRDDRFRPFAHLLRSRWLNLYLAVSFLGYTLYQLSSSSLLNAGFLVVVGFLPLPLILFAILLEGLLILAHACVGNRSGYAIWAWTFAVAGIATLIFLCSTEAAIRPLGFALSFLVTVFAIPRFYAARAAEQAFPAEFRSARPPSRLARRIVCVGLILILGFLAITGRYWPIAPTPKTAEYHSAQPQTPSPPPTIGFPSVTIGSPSVRSTPKATGGAPSPSAAAVATAPTTLGVDQAMRKADELDVFGNGRGAVGVLRKAISDHLNEPRLRDKLASLYAKHGDLGSAIAERQGAVNLEPGSPVYRNSLARDLCLAGRFSEALPHARKATQLVPRDFDYRDTLAHVAFALGKWNEAVELWEPIKKEQPWFFQTFSHPQCFEDLDRLAEAKLRKLDGEFPAANPFALP